MQNNPQRNQPDIKAALDISREVLIALSRNPSFDAVASGLSLYLALSGAGKRVTISSPSPITVEFNHLIGVDKISNNLTNTGRNLIVSFPYQEGSIEKVSYNIENDTFHLVIEPREGYPTITPEKLGYTFGGGSYETIIVIGAPSLNDLDSIYSQNQNLFTEKQVINIDNSASNARYGKINLVEPTLSSISEMVTNLLTSTGMRIDPDIATNLLVGITAGSNNFTSPTSGVATFEAAAICMRNGARKLGEGVIPQPSYQQAQPYQFPTQYNQPQNQPQSYQPSAQQTVQQPVRPVQPKQPQPQLRPMQQPRIQQQQRPQVVPQQQQPNQQKKKVEAPPDWLKPKIYKGSTLL